MNTCRDTVSVVRVAPKSWITYYVVPVMLKAAQCTAIIAPYASEWAYNIMERRRMFRSLLFPGSIGGINMAFEVIKPILLVLILSGCSSTSAESNKYTPGEYLKNYALSTCIADGFESAEVVTEAAAAARGYLELGDYPIEAYTEAALLGRQFLKKKYKSMSGQKLTLMKCIDFYHSRDLEALVKKYHKK